MADVNGDRKPDIVALGGSTCAWYENPTWKKRIVTLREADARHHQQRHGRPRRRRQGRDRHRLRVRDERADSGQARPGGAGGRAGDAWKLVPIADVGSIHRLRWGDVDGDTKLDLVVAPIFGPKAKPPAYDDPALVTAFQPHGDPKTGMWRYRQSLVVTSRGPRDRGSAVAHDPRPNGRA